MFGFRLALEKFIPFRKGRVSAISATARKLAVIIWNMVVRGTPYINPEGYLFLDQKIKIGLVKRIKKYPDIYQDGLTEEDLGLKTIVI
jgi:transposase